MIFKLRQGENSYQEAHIQYNNLNSSYKHIAGQVPCYINIVDIDNLHKCLWKMESVYLNVNEDVVPYIAIIGKHGNPIGIGIDYDSGSIAIDKALMGNPRANLGGEFISNFTISEESAKKLVDIKIDVISLWFPCKGLIKELLERNNISILVKKRYTPHDTIKSIDGGFIIQTPDEYILDIDGIDTNSIHNLIIAWATAYSSFHGGNEVAIAYDNRLIGYAGGPSTIESVNTVINRIDDISSDSTFCANAFFPFTDAPEILSQYCSFGIAPKGGIRFNEVKESFKKNGCNVSWLPEQYRGFNRH
jgi:AICAR transformylase/IMP cyclohydrolase PurH